VRWNSDAGFYSYLLIILTHSSRTLSAAPGGAFWFLGAVYKCTSVIFVSQKI